MDYNIVFEHASIYIAGRYNKYSRSLSQSPWVIDGQRKTETSVEELISIPLQKFFEGTETTFMSSGREDVDVRMLGNGRPFCIEMKSPKHVFSATQEKMTSLQRSINEQAGSQLSVRDLQIISKEHLNIIKDGEENKTKCYRALVWLSRPFTDEDINLLNQTQDIVVDQLTPMRVLHRRTLATRKKIIHKLRVIPIRGEYIMLDLLTQAGTYVKEFVHGDLGRTTPNIGTLLKCDADILYLDVLNINLDFPPRSIDNNKLEQ